MLKGYPAVGTSRNPLSRDFGADPFSTFATESSQESRRWAGFARVMMGGGWSNPCDHSAYGPALLSLADFFLAPRVF